MKKKQKYAGFTLLEMLKIVESQIELYTLEKNKTPSLNELVNEGYITKEQLDKYTAEKQ